MLQVRFHKDWALGPTLLFAGSGDDLLSLVSFFSNWSGQDADLLVALREQVSLYVDHVRGVNMRRMDLLEEFTMGQDGVAVWTLPRGAQRRVQSLLVGLLQANDAAHQYLGNSTDGIQIVCAKDEYPLPHDKTKVLNAT